MSRIQGGGRKGTLDHDRVLGALGMAFAEGYRAFRGGLAYRSDNPYKRGTQCRESWHAGWCNAEKLNGVYAIWLQTAQGAGSGT